MMHVGYTIKLYYAMQKYNVKEGNSEIITNYENMQQASRWMCCHVLLTERRNRAVHQKVKETMIESCFDNALPSSMFIEYIVEAFCVFYYIHHFHTKSGEHG